MKKIVVSFCCLAIISCSPQVLANTQKNEVATAIAQFDKGNFTTAAKVFLKYADTNPKAAAYAGRCYYNGAGVERNIELAKKYFSIAAKANEPFGLNGLGVIIQKESPEAAFALFEKAAQSGIKEALNNLGRSYVLGLGCKADTAKGRELLVKAVEKGSIPSAEFLGGFYQLFDDWHNACKYYTISAQAGSGKSKQELLFSQAMLDIYAKKYTDAYARLKSYISGNGIDNIRAYERLVWVCLKLEKKSEADKFLKNCIDKLNSENGMDIAKKADLCFTIAMNLNTLKHDVAEQEKFLLMSYELRKKLAQDITNLSLNESELIYSDLISFYSKNKMTEKCNTLMQEMMRNTSKKALKEMQKRQRSKK